MMAAWGAVWKAVSTSVFGEKGLAGGIVDTLQDAGILKDPEAKAAAVAALRNYEIRIREMDIDTEKIHAGDRASARAREMAVRDKVPGRLAFVAVAGFFGVLGLMIFVEIPAAAQDPLMIMLGILGAMVTGVINYYFGSSAGSADKNNTIKTLMGGGGKQPEGGK